MSDEKMNVDELIMALLQQDPTEVGGALRAAREALHRQVAVVNALLNEEALPVRRSRKSQAFADISNEQMLEELRTLATKLGRTPSQLDLVANPSAPSRDVLRRRFGSLGRAMVAAGLKPNEANPGLSKYQRALQARERSPLLDKQGGVWKGGSPSTPPDE